jgi:hypothetical protein
MDKVKKKYRLQRIIIKNLQTSSFKNNILTVSTTVLALTLLQTM